MNNNKKGFIEKLFYNNKFLFVFSIIIAITIWAAVKINYSADVTRTISEINIALNSSVSQESDYVAFLSDDEISAEVEVSGKAYNINSYALSKDDIIVEATTTYVDSAGYKVLTLSARVADNVSSDNVEIKRVTPSTITVYYDKKVTNTYNVEAKLKNDIETLVEGDYTVGQPVASVSTVDVSGPATILNKIEKVYFEAEVAETDLPLTQSKEVDATISYGLVNENEEEFLECEGIDVSNKSTVTIPVYMTKTVPVNVKFINQPSVYSDEAPKMTVSPSQVKVSYNPQDDEVTEYNVGTIDFSKLSNKVNTFDFGLNEKSVATVLDTSIDDFTVTIDMSSMSSVEFEKIPTKVVLLNKVDGYSYTTNLENSGLDTITVVGPKASLDKITVDNLQIEINVSSLDLTKTGEQTLNVSNISIQSDEVNDCWIYGKYKAGISVAKS